MKRFLCTVVVCAALLPQAISQTAQSKVHNGAGKSQHTAAAGTTSPASAQAKQAQPASGAATQRARRNIIIFVADGLRHGSVNAEDAPTMWAIRKQGVDFRNSYSLFPTFTTANASAIATGHMLGDTGDYSNSIWVGHALFDTGNFYKAPGTPVAFIENDQILSDLDDHFSGNYLGERTLLSLAREASYNTAAVGKSGPTAIQDVSAIAPVNRSMPPPSSALIVDDATGTPGGVPLPVSLEDRLRYELKIPDQTPERNNGFGAKSVYNNGYAGGLHKMGTLRPNLVQQQWFVQVATQAILPTFEADTAHPFILMFWSRDPDATQHNQGDSLDSASPGINGPTSKAAVKNADHNLRQLLDWLDAHPAVKANTDILITSDHGFATIARHVVDRTAHSSTAPSAQHDYLDEHGNLDSERGTLPPGCLALDIAWAFESKLWDPDQRGDVNSSIPFRQLRVDSSGVWEHPRHGNGLIGLRVEKQDGSDADVIVAANGGSDLIYVPDGNAERVHRIVNLLFTLDYVDSIFVDNEKYGSIPGTLSLKDINLVGHSKMPRPAIVVGFNHFYLDNKDLQSALQVSDTSLQDGQGIHGGFGRDSTYNNMEAIGPDFKSGYTDDAPVSNADIVPTLARIMGIALKPVGTQQGRVAEEALRGASDAPAVKLERQVSQPANGESTVLNYQEFGGIRYLHSSQREKTGQVRH